MKEYKFVHKQKWKNALFIYLDKKKLRQLAHKQKMKEYFVYERLFVQKHGQKMKDNLSINKNEEYLSINKNESIPCTTKRGNGL